MTTLLARIAGLEQSRRDSGTMLLEQPLTTEELADLAHLWDLTAEETRAKLRADAADIDRCRAFLRVPGRSWTMGLIATLTAWWECWPGAMEPFREWLEAHGIRVGQRDTVR